MFNRIFLTAPIALAVSAAFIGAAAGPANAATTDICATAPTQLRTAAATASPDVAKKALHDVETGVQLCNAKASFEAKKSFAAASKLLGVDFASLSAVTVAAQ
jgi:hypothetical protein